MRSSPTLGPTLTWLRWTVITTMLLIALAWPGSGRTGQQLWILALGFGGYNLIVELVRRSSPRFQTYAWVPFFDLPVTGVLCSFGADAGGPLFVGFFLAVLTAANYLTLRFTMLYIAVVVVAIIVIVPTLPAWSETPSNLRQLAARIVVLVMLGVGTAILTRRIVRHAEYAGDMRHEAERLEELDRLRSEFIATVSHDLKTPLISMQAGLGLMASSAGDRLLPDERRLVDNAQRNVVRLALFIDDLLLVNQIRSRTLVISRRRIDLREAVREAISIVDPLLPQKRQTLEVDLPMPLPVEGESRRLGQVVVNLLANAHSHTPPGTRIAVAGTVESGRVRLSVRDDGPGIPETEIESVFRRYHRLSASGGGSGLGLADARLLVELHGGRLWVESRPGEGAAFHITLPLAGIGAGE